ncbi:MAG TPA: AraC family transcriptional regulator [Gemmatimonadales bacterium]|nr:AraC family transcriptional regulator [Gemmatimonadales bacterium]
MRSADPPAKRLSGATQGLRVSLVTDPAGLVESPPCDGVRVCIHAGPPVYAVCRHGSQQHRGTIMFGDVDIIPPRTAASWELNGPDVDLVVTIDEALLRTVVQDGRRDPRGLEIRSRFQIRDARIEHIGWALMAEMESGYPSGELYLEGLAVGLAASIVQNHSSFARDPSPVRGGKTARRLREATSFIEDNLGRRLALGDIARAAGWSVSHLTPQFRRSIGMSVHQYVIRRRVDRAAGLLRTGTLSVSQVAVEVGFCHQSLLARHMRRLLGVSPRDLRERAS